MGFFDYKFDEKKYKTQIDSLKTERDSLKEELAALKLKKKIEEEDIKHMLHMKTEAMELEKERMDMKFEKKAEKAIREAHDKYRTKVEDMLGKQVTDLKEMYGQILARLPDVNVKLKG